MHRDDISKVGGGPDDITKKEYIGSEGKELLQPSSI